MSAKTLQNASLVLVLLFAVTLMHSARAQVPAPNDHLIVPWKRIGAAALGMTKDELVRVMGEPASKWPGIVDTYNWQDFSAMVTKDGLWTTQLCTFSSAYATAEGVGPGSTDDSVSVLLGQPKYSRVFSGWWRFSFSNLYWPGLMVSVHLKGYATNHAVWKVCVNQSSSHV
jgi:outer membrane protein assembly factor BamE (lipoprotein component of BamABCDE complex)